MAISYNKPAAWSRMSPAAKRRFKLNAKKQLGYRSKYRKIKRYRGRITKADRQRVRAVYAEALPYFKSKFRGFTSDETAMMAKSYAFKVALLGAKPFHKVPK